MNVVLFTCCPRGTPQERAEVRNSVVGMPEIATYAQLRLHGTTLAITDTYAVTLHDEAEADRVAQAIRGLPGIENVSIHPAEHNHP